MGSRSYSDHICGFKRLQLVVYHGYGTTHLCHMHWSIQNGLEVVLEPQIACTILPGTHCMFISLKWKSQFSIHLTLRYTGYFWSFRHNSCSSNTIEILKHFLGLGQSSYPCDQIHMKIGPNQTFLLKLWSFKVAGGGHYDHPPCNVGLNLILLINKSYLMLYKCISIC